MAYSHSTARSTSNYTRLTEASTIASKVVGILMYAIPRLKVAAAKPPKSVTIPPPQYCTLGRITEFQYLGH